MPDSAPLIVFLLDELSAKLIPRARKEQGYYVKMRQCHGEALSFVSLGRAKNKNPGVTRTAQGRWRWILDLFLCIVQRFRSCPPSTPSRSNKGNGSRVSYVYLPPLQRFGSWPNLDSCTFQQETVNKGTVRCTKMQSMAWFTDFLFNQINLNYYFLIILILS